MSEKDLFSKLKSEFLLWYEEQKEIAYYFTAKDAGNLSGLIKKIQFVGKEKHKNEGNEWIINAFKWILGHLPKWIMDTPTIPIINSKFNEILANGRTRKPLRNLSQQYLTDVIRRSGVGNIQAEQPPNGSTDFRGKGTSYRAIGEG